MDVVLLRLSVHLEKMESIRRRIKSAMIYPVIVVSVAVIVLAVVILFVIPVFAELFEDLGTTLPALTQVIINVSLFARQNILYIIAAIAILIVLIAFLHRKSYRARRLLDAFLLRLWLVGSLILKTVVARFSRTLATLTAGGIPILDGLEITAKASGNLVIEEAILDARVKCPVSERIRAILIVSKSLISPIRITSGSSLSTLLNA